MSHAQLKEYCRLDDCSNEMLKTAMNDLHFDASSHDCILKVARIIGDMGGSKSIATDHLLEALRYRNLDRNIWP